MVYNKYIGIIGGTGTIGSIIVKYLLPETGNKELEDMQY